MFCLIPINAAKTWNIDTTHTVSADVEVERMHCLTRPPILRLFQASMWGQEVNNAVNPGLEMADLRLRVAVRLSEEDYPRFILAH